MKLILLSDLHLLWNNPAGRKDDLTVTQFEKLKFVFDYTVKYNGIILQAGDFFDRPRSWYLLPKFLEFMDNYPDLDIYSVAGQHDVYMYHADTLHATNIGILDQVGFISLLGNFQCAIESVRVYGCNWGQEVPKVKDKTKFNILVAHASVGKEALFPGHEYIDAKKYLKKHKDYDLILVGDIHRQFEVKDGKRVLLNTGPLLRKESSVYNFEHELKFVVFDSEKRTYKWITIPHKLADEVLSREHIEKSAGNKAMLDEFIESVDSEFEAEVDFKSNLEKFIKANDIDEDVTKILSEVMQDE